MRNQRAFERFWSKVEVLEDSKCWPWRAGKNKDGYGMFLWNGRSERAHRIAFFFRHKKFPLHGLHTCDNPRCCNPSHIYSGTHIDNMRDMTERARHWVYRGEKHYAAKLNERKVAEIKSRYAAGGESMAGLASYYGVSFSAVQRVLGGKSWLKPTK